MAGLPGAPEELGPSGGPSALTNAPVGGEEGMGPPSLQTSALEGDGNAPSVGPSTWSAMSPPVAAPPTRRDTLLVMSPELAAAADLHPKYPKRTRMLYQLLRACKTLDHIRVIPGRPATVKELLEFHSGAYLKALHSAHRLPQSRLAAFGLEDDCAPFRGLWPYVLRVAGATLAAADALVEERATVAIAWTGGRHHAGRTRASGFCFVNDVVLALLRLQRRFARVLYLDVDLHHGDAVQDAFAYSRSVVTASLHKRDVGFFPHTGAAADEGHGSARWHLVNLPLRNGIGDAAFSRLFRGALSELVGAFRPKCIVLQCGADGLAADPHHAFNLTSRTYEECAREARRTALPLLVLGGGGYNVPDTVRTWAHVTAALAGAPPLPHTIPENEFFEEYAPSFSTRTAAPRSAADENGEDRVRRLLAACSERAALIRTHTDEEPPTPAVAAARPGCDAGDGVEADSKAGRGLATRRARAADGVHAHRTTRRRKRGRGGGGEAGQPEGFAFSLDSLGSGGGGGVGSQPAGASDFVAVAPAVGGEAEGNGAQTAEAVATGAG